jgi:hypothetical protein
MASRRKRERSRSSGGHREPKSAQKTRTKDIVPRSPRGNKRSVTPPSWTVRRFDALSDTQRDTYFRAKKVLDEGRDGKPPTRSARDNKTTLATVRKYFPNDFSKSKGSRRWNVSPSDKHPNQVQWLGKNGYEDFVLRGSRDASRLGSYLNDVKRALRGERSALDKWHGKKVGGRKLITNLEVLTRLGREGKLDFEDELLWRS